MDLFTANTDRLAPLADRMRPTTLQAFVGQEHIVGQGRLLRRAIETDSLTSSIFFGPPGTGKTTLASIIAQSTGAAFEKLNAVTSGVKEVRTVIDAAGDRLKLYGKATYLLLDECHRWSRTQSDSILPAIEKGIIRFIGSTTENPFVSMSGAIVSRCRIFEFRPLDKEDVKQTLLRAISDTENGLGKMRVRLEPDALEHIANLANGDARSALNALELAALTTKPDSEGVIVIDLAVAEESIQHRAAPCDDTQFYDMLSAFCKSLRGSDADAALLWFARLVQAGVDARVIARRLIAHASEDVGLANPAAMLQAVAAAQAVELIGMPEARLPLAQAIIFICESPKSNAVVMAVDGALADARDRINEPVPLPLRDTSYRGAEKLGNGKGYQYAHDYPGHYVVQQYVPDDMVGRVYYHPSDQGQEQKIRENRKTRRRYGDAQETPKAGEEV
ncbi:MAG: replication-associated recombination protein A, partial [Bacillota bacterium]